MKPILTPYARALDAAPKPRLQLPAHVDGQRHYLRLPETASFLFGAIFGALLVTAGGCLVINLWILRP